MKKIFRLILLITFLPLSAFANNAFMYIKVCNFLNSYGTNGGPLYHNIQYVVKPLQKPKKTENLKAIIPWSGNCQDALIFGDVYPLEAELTIMDQQTGVGLWKGIVSKEEENGSLNFSHLTRQVDDQGNTVCLSYFPGQISVQRC